MSENTRVVTLKESFFGEEFAKGTWICLGINCFCMLTGLGAVNVFATTILTELSQASSGSFPITPKAGAYLVGLTNLVFAFLATVPLKFFGLRTILIWGQALMTICHILIGVFRVAQLYVPLFVFILAFIAFFQLTIGSVSFIYAAEVCVDSAVGIVIAGQYFCMLLLSITVQYMVASPLKAQGTFWFYAGLTLIGGLFMIVFVKETRGLSDRQKQELYNVAPKNRITPV